MTVFPVGGIARRRRSPCAAFAALGLLAPLTSGCVEREPVALAAGSGDSTEAVATRPGASPRGASLSLASIEGAPDAATRRFRQATLSAAAARDVTLVDEGSAAYAARGYLSSYPVEGGGTAFVSVWDLYDGARRRSQRLQDSVVVKAASADPWSVFDDGAAAALAARAAADIAASLADTPEAGRTAPSARIVAADPPGAR